MRPPRTSSFAASFAVLLALAAPARAGTKLLRFPDIHKDRVAFCYGGDLWVAPSSGGVATRLTAHEGLELFPKFSPDGAWIAFTGQYDGDEQVYVIPAGGGVPKQLTWYPARGPLPARWGYDNQVYGWTPDGKAVLFRSLRDAYDLVGTRLFTVGLEGGLPVPLPMPVSGGGDLASDMQHAVYSPLTRDFRTWKRYEGGWAQDLYIFDFQTRALTPVAHSPRTERDPMWIGDQIWFASDRDGTLNLYDYDSGTQKVTQATHETQWDVRWPSKGESGEIVFELNGELRVLDTKSGKVTPIEISVPTDGVAMRPAHVAVGDSIESAGLSPKGERALIVARGDVFSVPIEKGATRNLTRTSGVHEREARWSPDGARIATISDRTGEEELWLLNQDGSGEPEQLTSSGQRRRQGPLWSPDGKSIALSDSTGALQCVEVASKSVREVARDKGGNVGDYSWSPDSRWLAFSLQDENGFRSIWIWSAEDGKLVRVTGELWNESEPCWDPSGNYLWYLSDREYAPQMNGLEWNITSNRTTGIFALALRKDVAHPFPPESDEVTLKKPEEKKEEPKSDEPKKVAIDFEGLAERVVRVPLEADNHSSLTANKEHLFCLRSGAFYYGRESERTTALMAFSLKERKASVLVEDAGGYSLSDDGSKLLVRSGAGFALYDASSKGKDSKKTISTAGLMADRVPHDEWVEAFHEVWRRFRDYFYVPNMHGYDWDALRQQYEGWLPYVAHRSDLNYVLGEMVAELNIGHAYVTGGDWVAPQRHAVALFGGRLALDSAAGRYKIAAIFRGQNEEESYRSPLTEVGVDAHVGDYVLAIDGQDLPASENPYRLLRDKADRPVEFLLNEKPVKEGARKVLWRPLRSETSLIYLDWVESRRAIVDKLSGGRIGYMHLPDMGAAGISEFGKWYYGQIRKEGLILDDRGNGGGNVSQIILERLRRTLLGTEYPRNSDYTGTYPQVVFSGPMACLLNEDSASDGDIFPWMFKAAKLGPTIGKRSWGGVVGITNHGPLIDGGSVNVPEFGHADANGQWAVEGHGVDPDIVVGNDPRSELEGRDPQLERALQEVLTAMQTRKAALPPRPPAPVKTK
jgi:tricorn protease